MVLEYALPLLLFAGTVPTTRPALAGELPLVAALLVGFAVPGLPRLPRPALCLRARHGDLCLTALSFGFPAIAFTESQ